MALFIGGPLDGKILEIDPERITIEVAIEHNIAEALSPQQLEQNTLKTLTDIFYYKREVLKCPGNEFPIYVPRSYSCSDVIASLIEGYHQSVIQAEFQQFR